MKNEHLFKKTTSIVAATTLLASFTTTTIPVAALAKPNVLLIMCDQLRADALGAYGNTFAKTPNIDALAKEGTVFQNTYTQSPVCVPARMCVLSGLYPFQTGTYQNTYNGWGQASTTYPEEFEKNGYNTYNSGKVHVPVTTERPIWQVSTDIRYNNEQSSNGTLGTGFLNFDYKTLKIDGSFFAGVMPEVKKNVTVTSDVIDLAIKDVSAAEAANKPFLLTTSIMAPHTPVLVLPEYYDMYNVKDMNYDITPESDIDAFAVFEKQRVIVRTDAEIRRVRATYAAMVAEVDDQIGRLIRKLKQDGIYENTIIIFTADHGCINGEFNQFEKSRYIEYAARVPLIIKGPGLPIGKLDTGLTETTDIAKTIISAAGLPVPKQMMQARNLFDPSEPIRTELISQIGNGENVRSYIRTKEFAFDLNTHLDRGQVNETTTAAEKDGQFIDLRVDPLGHKNLYNDPNYQTIIQTLEAKLRARIQK